MVAFILFFPLIVSPIVFLLTRKFNSRSLMTAAIPLSIISFALGLFLLLSDIGIVARGFGLWGVFFALGTWRTIVIRARSIPQSPNDEGHQ